MRSDEFVKSDDYKALVQRSADSPWKRQVRLDAPRTFPNIKAFDEEWQGALERLLLAHTILCPELGYCQGMSFVAGIVLLVADGDEEPAFWFLVQLLKNRKVRSLFQRGLPGVGRWACAFEVLLGAAAPELSKHFTKEEVEPGLYLQRWFLSLFANGLPLGGALVFWDALLHRGLDSAVLLALNLVLSNKEMLLQSHDDELFTALRSLGNQSEASLAPLAQAVIAHDEEAEVLARVLASLRDEMAEFPEVSKWQCSCDNMEIHDAMALTTSNLEISNDISL